MDKDDRWIISYILIMVIMMTIFALMGFDVVEVYLISTTINALLMALAFWKNEEFAANFWEQVSGCPPTRLVVVAMAVVFLWPVTLAYMIYRYLGGEPLV